MTGSADQKVIETEPVFVRVFTANFEIEGLIHTKPGGYFNRVTDLLNLAKMIFVSLTRVRYRLRGSDEDFTSAERLVVKDDDIEITHILEGTD